MRLVEGLEARCASYLQKGSKATLGRPMAPAGPTRRHDARQERRRYLAITRAAAPTHLKTDVDRRPLAAAAQLIALCYDSIDNII